MKTLTVKQFNVQVDNLGKQFNDKVGKVQALLVQAVLFSFQDGNVSPAAYLFNGLGNAVNRESIGHWFAKYGIRVSYSSSAKAYSAKMLKDEHAKRKAEYAADQNVVEAWLADLFTNIDKNKGRDFTGMSLDAAIAAAVKRYEATKTKHKDEPNVKFDDGLLDYWKAGLARSAKRSEVVTETLN